MAEGTGIEPVLVLPRLRFSKPTHYRSGNLPKNGAAGGSRTRKLILTKDAFEPFKLQRQKSGRPAGSRTQIFR